MSELENMTAALNHAKLIIENYEMDIRSGDWTGVNLVEKGFCQGSLYKKALETINKFTNSSMSLEECLGNAVFVHEIAGPQLNGGWYVVYIESPDWISAPPFPVTEMTDNKEYAESTRLEVINMLASLFRNLTGEKHSNVL